MDHGDLFRKVFHELGHERNPFHVHITLSPSDQVPVWAKPLLQQVASIQRNEADMRDSTKALVDAVTDLKTKAAAIETAIDSLKDAQDAGDEEAIKQATADVVQAASDLASHTPAVEAAVPPVVTAPADTPPAA